MRHFTTPQINNIPVLGRSWEFDDLCRCPIGTLFFMVELYEDSRDAIGSGKREFKYMVKTTAEDAELQTGIIDRRDDRVLI